MSGDPIGEAIAAAVERGIRRALPEIIAQLRSSMASPPASGRTDKWIITVPVACRRYGIGRASLLDLVTSGRLPSTTRRMRGGRSGHMLRVEDCERVLAGRSP